MMPKYFRYLYDRYDLSLDKLPGLLYIIRHLEQEDLNGQIRKVGKRKEER